MAFSYEVCCVIEIKTVLQLISGSKLSLAKDPISGFTYRREQTELTIEYYHWNEWALTI